MISTTTVVHPHFQIPAIRILDEPSEDRFTSLPARALRLKLNTSDNTSLASAVRPIARPWRGHCDRHGSLYLRVPSHAATAGSRLALARQGVAMGSYKLNCAETVFANGRRKSQPDSGSGVTLTVTRVEGQSESSSRGKGMEERTYLVDGHEVDAPRIATRGVATHMRSYHPPPKIRTRFDMFNEEITPKPYNSEDSPPESPSSPAPSFIEDVKTSLLAGLKHGHSHSRTNAKKIPPSTGLSNLSRSYTFTEGLCNLVEPDDDDTSQEDDKDKGAFKDDLEADKAKIKSRLGLQSGMRSSITVSGSLRRLAHSMDTASRKWFDSLRRMQIMERKAGETLRGTTSFRSLTTLSKDLRPEQLSGGTSASGKHRPLIDIFPELHGFKFADLRFNRKKAGQRHKGGKTPKERKRRSLSDLRTSEQSDARDEAPQERCSSAQVGLPRSASLPASKFTLVADTGTRARKTTQSMVFV